MSWKVEYARKFRSEQIENEKVSKEISDFVHGLNEIFKENGIDEKVQFISNKMIFPDCAVSIRVNSENNEVEFTKLDKKNQSSVIDSLRVRYREGYYNITNTKKNLCDNKYLEFNKELVDCVFRQLL
ncbi:hypothetical protein [Desulforamulus aeronauticus]|uniref:Uncharacterized protein n=1 Tax=Desulforamulus aeronauticus DSM 10349 TaxID=1121421 RepID=A0A1M6SBE8_9FIRM|nr:hypothetical protein [Desulforamulus aeronauticus]SHK42041.1 hypothetical protein SAMN02745123_01785 [Desulforamulus aeronauticus DSM 10349]